MKRSSTIFVLVALLPVPLVLALGWSAMEKSVPHPMNEAVMSAHYRGFGLQGAPGILGRKWTAVTYVPPDAGGYWRFEFEAEGYNRFRGYYPDGTLREEGECYVEVMGLPPQPFPDPHNLHSARCYRPDGSLFSEVINGTGVQTICTPEGVKTWELELKDFQRVRLTMWHPNGRLQQELQYVSGKPHGLFVTYDAEGRKTTEGAYKTGERTGTWTRYDPDGSVVSLEQYGGT